MTEPRQPPAPSTPPASFSQWFAVPHPIRRLFKLFPLQTYDPNELPERSPSSSSSRGGASSSGRAPSGAELRHNRSPVPALYVFSLPEDSARGRPSFNPACLKWQAFLKIAGVDVELVPSNNHASPSGALPFLLLPDDVQKRAGGGLEKGSVVSASKLHRYALDHGVRGSELRQADERDGERASLRLEAYQALLDNRIRIAWLHALYLAPANQPVVSRLYLGPVSNSSLVRLATYHQLRSAAEAEVLKATGRPYIDVPRIYADAKSAFAALSTLLGEKLWFGGVVAGNGLVGGDTSGAGLGESVVVVNKEDADAGDGVPAEAAGRPSLFDAAVFAYTHLLLDEEGHLGWQDAQLGDAVREFPNLVAHRKRLYEMFFVGA